MKGRPVRTLAGVLAMAAAVMLTACGGGSNGVPVGMPGPGNFTNASLMGSYAFSYQGNDVNGFPFVAAGQFTANGSGVISGGAIDLNDELDQEFLSPSTNNGTILGTSTYTVSSNGETSVTLQTNGGLQVVLQLTLTSSSHGLLIAFDGDFVGSGTIDLQNTTALFPTNVAFSVSGVDLILFEQASMAGNLLVNGSSIVQGTSVVDAVAPGLLTGVDGGASGGDTMVSGTITPDNANPGRSTVQLSTQLGTFMFAAYIVDNTEVELAEIDAVVGLQLGGQGFAAPVQGSQTLNGNYAFSVNGEAGKNLATFGAGGVFTASSTAITGGEIDVHSTQVFPVANLTNTVYTPDPNFARIVLTLTSPNGSFQYAAYPTNRNSLLLVEIDDTTAVSSGTAYKQTTTTAPSGSFAINLSGLAFTQHAVFAQDAVGQIGVSGTTITGELQINNIQNNSHGLVSNAGLTSSMISSTDMLGRGSNMALNSGNIRYVLTFYTVDGSRVLMLEIDNTRISTGLLLLQTD